MIPEMMKTFEDVTDFPKEEYEIATEIKKSIDFEKINEGELEEAIAFSLYEDYNHEKTAWGTYFGPQAVYLPNGTSNEFPVLQQITIKVYNYWEKRFEESQNPLLKSRYAGLIIDFAKHVGAKVNPLTVRNYIENLIQTVEKRLVKHPSSAFRKLKRALELSIRFSFSDLVEQVKIATRRYEAEIAVDDKPGLWINSYEILMKNPGVPLTKDEKNEIITDLENRLGRLTTPNTDGKVDPFSAEAAVEKLVEYYRANKAFKDVERVVMSLGSAFELITKDVSSFETIGRLQRLHKLYIKYGFKSRAEEVLVKIREVGPRMHEEMSVTQTKHDLPADKVNQLIDEILQGDPVDVYSKIAGNFLPSQENAKNQIESQARKTPLQFIFQKDLVDSKGRTITTVGPLETDLAGHLAVNIAASISFNSLFFNACIF